MANKRIRDKRHLRRICEDGCMFSRRDAIPHHLMCADRGMGLKAADNHAIPINWELHNELHRIGEPKFLAMYGWTEERIIKHAEGLYKETLQRRGK